MLFLKFSEYLVGQKKYQKNVMSGKRIIGKGSVYKLNNTFICTFQAIMPLVKVL